MIGRMKKIMSSKIFLTGVFVALQLALVVWLISSLTQQMMYIYVALELLGLFLVVGDEVADDRALFDELSSTLRFSAFNFLAT